MKHVGAIVLMLVLAVGAGTGQATAGRWKLDRQFDNLGNIDNFNGRQLVQADGDYDAGAAQQQYSISARDAAGIAKDANPGSKVLKVQLLPSGFYAVTLKQGGEVSRVMVDATSGSIN